MSAVPSHRGRAEADADRASTHSEAEHALAEALLARQE
jgi:hypothetical protein